MVKEKPISRAEHARHEQAPRVLVVDDEKVIREILSDFLTMEGFLVRTVEDGEAAVAELQRRAYNLVITDLKMPKLGGLELLAKINELCPDVLTVIMTGFGTVETAIEAMKNGAYDYILKPFKVEEVVHIVRRGLDRQHLQLENIRLRETLSLYRISEAISQSLTLDHVLGLILEATAGEVNADAVSLLLQGDKEFKHRRTYRNRKTCDTDLGEINLNEIQRFFEQDLPLLAHESKAHRFFNRPPQSERLVSLCTIPLVARQEFVGVLCVYSFTRGLRFTEGQRKVLSILGSRASVSIENARLYENLLVSNRELAGAKLSLEENFRQTIVAFAHALEESDRYTRGHSERVAMYARLIAQQLDVSDSEMDTIVLAAELHDIGKIGIPTEKLNKPGPLNPEELQLLRTHPDKGKRILEPIPFLQQLIPGVYCHHENWDGRGYPQGLAGEEIPRVGRIVAVADSYDAMTTDRAYRRALPHDVAIAELVKGSGSQFDPQMVEIFVTEIQRLKSNFRSTQPVELPKIPAALNSDDPENDDVSDPRSSSDIAAAAG